MSSTNGHKKRVEVICLTYGEPWQHKWYPQFTYSLSILNRLTRRVAPIPKFITPYIAMKRGFDRKATFIETDYRSPLECISNDQVATLQEVLSERRPDCEFRVRLALEFRPPNVKVFLDELMNDPPDELILFPLYLASSDFTDGVSRTDLDCFHKKLNGKNPLPRPKYVTCIASDMRTAEVMADFIMRNVQEAGWSEEKCKNAILMLGAHGTVIDVPEGIRNGANETFNLFLNIRKLLRSKFKRVRNGWLNHEVGGTWTAPDVDHVAEKAHNAGIRDVVYFPYGFMGDNAETELEGREALDNFEWNDVLYLKCTNNDRAFMELMATRVLERMDYPGEKWDALELNPNFNKDYKSISQDHWNKELV